MKFIDFVHNLGLEIGYIIGGAIGSLVFMSSSKNKKRPMWEKIIIVLVGIGTANYLTPLLVWILGIPGSVQYGISFVIGYMGLNGLGLIIDGIRDKVKKK